ncbi:MAG: hypothetical protein KDB14_15820 [Planctomycetales bacterium]|nr:hypothetical protein [Planctomycetales bacterium]
MRFHVRYPTPDTHRRETLRACSTRGQLRLVIAAWLMSIVTSVVAPSGGWAQVELSPADVAQAIRVVAPEAQRWRQEGYDMWLLRGRVAIQQGRSRLEADEAVLWVDEAEPGSGRSSKLLVYLEGNVRVAKQRPGSSLIPSALLENSELLTARSWYGQLQSFADLQFETKVVGGEPRVSPNVLRRGRSARDLPIDGAVQPVQFLAPAEPAEIPPTGLPSRLPAPDETMSPVSGRSVSIRQRSSVAPSFTIRNLPDRNESLLIVTNGISVVIDDVVVAGSGQREAVPLGRIDIETDQLVAWSQDVQSLLGKTSDGQAAVQPRDLPLELYLEGNIVFRQGDRVIYADRMYYDVAQRRGVVLDAEMLSGVPNYDGVLRLKADVLQQVNEQRFEAFNASLTSSRMGVPRYWFQSGNLTVVDTPRPKVDPLTGRVKMDPVTQEADVEHHFNVTSRNNFVYVGGAPVLYWPVLASNMDRPSFYLDRIKLKSDRVFGQQLYVDWNLYQLLGIENPLEGSEWQLSTDYLSDRGLALGTQFRYTGDGALGIPGPAKTLLDAWGIKDTGLDDLGLDRRAVPPEDEWRGRVLLQHQQEAPMGFQLSAQLGWISDRNFLEQYFESEWDLLKDQDTAIELKQQQGLQSWDVYAKFQLNDFFMETEWLPRADHYLLGKPLWGSRLTYYEHSHVGYARLNPATAPLDAGELAKFDPLYGEIPVEGLRAASRHELNMPLRVGPLQVTPFVSGEVAYYHNDIMGNELTRVLGQAGVRNSTVFWKTNPEFRSALFNLNGISHKVVIENELLFAEADEDLTSIPRYDSLDDNAQEFFRRRFFFDTFGGMAGMDIADRFSDRYFGVRSGLQNWVTAEATDIVEDLMVGRMSVRQRLQTKRGLPGQERIVDWITFDVDMAVFPKADRDNFGAEFGMLDYDYRWHLGDRLTVVSDGYFDFFNDGLRTFSLGGIINRPSRGNLYLAYRSLEGPLSSNILVASLDYRMSRKWIMHAGAVFDFGSTGNIGQSLAFTKIGESTLLRAGVSFDESRDNVSLQFAIEPRLLPSRRLRQVTGIELPPVGAAGIE